MNGIPGWTFDALALTVLVLQVPMVLVLLARLLPSLRRPAPLPADPPDFPALPGSVSVIVPTLNEAERIDPCLQGLHAQGSALREVLVVDSRSQDGTPEKVWAMATRDPRFRLVTDDPLPTGWVGRPWALHYGFLKSDPTSEWILGIDADTRPQPGLVERLLETAQNQGFDLITLAPQFILQHWGEGWLQPALLVTLIYRYGAAGDPATLPERTMANGQCMLVRRSVLESMDGYTVARASFCDDVTLVRQIAVAGFKVGFWDGRHLLKVRMYTSFRETWREWGRSLDLKDATPAPQLWGDVVLLVLTQGIPWVTVLGLLGAAGIGLPFSLTESLLLGLNLGLIAFRFRLLAGIRGSYQDPPWTFWLSPLADPLAVLRIVLSALSRPRSWRGRTYSVSRSSSPHES
ncbi:glycosyltransferase [Synechococcus sp. Nb3U1]|uniref:glycosyltransferase n=1 Tax=Synechococcus sp. Nb3U1 TaxID=1914529 RepID=UPI001F2DF492|nr:glycosyltransferase family 2 protein [Synechococcus sp. Nb3U1]MCF2971071.1 glycosyltransferase [Synechococcus sp. Nb3U1]